MLASRRPLRAAPGASICPIGHPSLHGRAPRFRVPRCLPPCSVLYIDDAPWPPARSYLPDDQRLQCFHALQVAHRVHAHQRRKDGQPFVTHPVAVANLVASWGMDGNSVVAALLHDAVEDTPLTFAEVEACFGEEVRTLVQGVTRVSKVDESKLADFGELRLSTLGAEDAGAKLPAGMGVSTAAPNDILLLLHACAGDWRIGVLKCADRLHNMRTLGAMPQHKRAKKAVETERVFVPLAHYLGAHEVGHELAKLAAQHKGPVEDQPTHKVWVDKLARAVLAAPVRATGGKLSSALFGGLDALRLPMWKQRPDGRGFLAARAPEPQPRSAASESSFYRLVQSLSADDEPARAQHLYVSLRPLHESLTRHQAVMMRSGWDAEEADDAQGRR